MTAAVKVAADAATRFAVQLVSAILIGALITWLIISGLARGTGPLVASSVFIVCLLTILLVTGIYLLNRENHRLKEFPYDLHGINHVYRDTLSRLFSDNIPPDPEELLLAEREVLNTVSVKVANIFRNLIGRKCVVTVKLLTEEDGRTFCFTWARSDREVLREAAPLEKYLVGTGENTGFDEALKLRPSRPSYFYSHDLLKAAARGRYSNQRAGWERLYQSTIVVPIRHVVGPARIDVIGFLCIDTMSTNRLNDSYHVELLAAFADQIYNFLSIMRRRYLVASEAPAKTSATSETANASG